MSETVTPMTADEGAARMLAMIAADVAAGVVPWDVPDYRALHDFVDANTYGLDLVQEMHPGVPGYYPGGDEQGWLAQVERAVNARLSGTRCDLPPRS